MGAFLAPAAIIGGAQLLGGLGGALVQRGAANRAAQRAAQLGRQGQQIISTSTPQARRELEAGFQGAQGFLGGAGTLLEQGQQNLAAQFQQERELGQQALGRLSDVVLGGDVSQLQIDPGFEFRRQEGERAIARQAAAAGSFGGGGNLRDFARFNQGLASQEFGNALQRLVGLQQIGSAANLNFAQLNQGLLGQRVGVAQNQAQVAQNQGGALAQLTQTAAANRANVLANQAANVNAFNLQAANAAAQGFQGAGNAIGNAATLFALAQLFQGQNPQVDTTQVPSDIASARTPPPFAPPRIFNNLGFSPIPGALQA